MKGRQTAMPFNRRYLRSMCTVITLMVPTFACSQVEYIAFDNNAGASQAVVVDGVPLVHTTQLLPTDAQGNIVATERQIARALDNLNAAMRTASDDCRWVKLNVYATNEATVKRVQQHFAKAFATGNAPAVCYVVTPLPGERAIVAMDGVAAIRQRDMPKAVRRRRSASIAGPANHAHASVLPLGYAVYISGQAAKGDLAEATRLTMQGLHETLKDLNLTADDVVQVKTFVTPMSDIDVVNAEIAKFYATGLVPPVSHVEWISGNPIEIEMIAYARSRPETVAAGEPVVYVTPRGMKSSPVFSRVAVIETGRRVYTSGIVANDSDAAESEIRAIFTDLDTVLKQAGTDLRHLAKATYYVTDNETSRLFGKIRLDVYDPLRPPAASKATVTSVGFTGKTISLDMIAVMPRHGK